MLIGVGFYHHIGLYIVLLFSYCALCGLTRGFQKLFLAEQTVHDSALQTRQKQRVKRAKFYRFNTLNFYLQCWICSFFGGRLSPKVVGLASVVLTGI